MKCRLCGNNNLHLYYTQGNNDQYKFYKCNNCRLVNYDLATGLNQGKYSEVFISPYDLKRKMNKDQTSAYQYIKNKIKGKGRMLDIGCGNGRLLQLAREDGWDVKGIELFESYAEAVKKELGIPVEAVNFLEYELKKNDKFDIVILRHVLEHIPDSITAMKKINKLIRLNSYAVIEFPNIEGLDLKFKRFLRRTGIHRKKYKDDYKPGHCNEFSKESFEYLLDITGFILVDWTTYSTKPLSNFIYNIIHVGSKARSLIQKTKEL